jgi:hypothetical protein
MNHTSLDRCRIDPLESTMTLVNKVIDYDWIKTYTLIRRTRIERRDFSPQRRPHSTRDLGPTDSSRNCDWHGRLARAEAHEAPFLQSATSAPTPGTFVIGLNIGSGHRISLGNLLASISTSDGIAVTPRPDSWRRKRKVARRTANRFPFGQSRAGDSWIEDS